MAVGVLGILRIPYAPIHSASGFGVGFECLNSELHRVFGALGNCMCVFLVDKHFRSLLKRDGPKSSQNIRKTGGIGKTND